jgi:magnesium-transporting ATPase (P-type)
VENVDRSNAENKLIDFLARSHELYREVKHQQRLTEQNLSGMFSRENIDIATWITFLLAILTNVMFIVYYETNGGDPNIDNHKAYYTIQVLNIAQVVVAVMVLILCFGVRSPVVFQRISSSGCSQLEAILLTACDMQTMYYVLYLVLSIFGLLIADYYLPFLLLDIVSKNATTRDVLNAVVIPRKQLGMTTVLAIFLTYIYAYFLVSSMVCCMYHI